MNSLIRFVGLAVCLLAGCVVDPVPRYRVRASPSAAPPLTSEEIVRMSKAGISEAVITELIKADGIAARPTAEQIPSLRKEGLSDLVIQSMMTARVPEETVHAYPYYPYYPPYDDPWWYRDAYWCPWPHYGWWLWCYPYRDHHWRYPRAGSPGRYRP